MKPILFNTDMVKAILMGRKTVTRRLMKGYPLEHLEVDVDGSVIGIYQQDEGAVFPAESFAPYRPGDILYVRETWGTAFNPIGGTVGKLVYRADGNPLAPTLSGKWRPSIHMPRYAARLFLRVTDIRAERLHDIDDEQAMREGIGDWFCGMGEHGYAVSPYSDTFYDGPVGAFAALWNSTIKPKDRALYVWSANPWVWVIEFERISREEAERE